MGSSDSPGASSSSLEAASPAALGDIIASKYRVERVLGRGAMGIVVAARHLQLDQAVAIKLLHRESRDDQVAVERFEREARAAAQLRSDHAARVLDVGRLPDETPYMVMELLEGADLGEVLDLRGPLPVELACTYVVQACEAVAEAHARGIVHRNLKPENLYLATRVGGASMVKVLDFGISKVMTDKQGSLTQTRAVVGSPLYMAPEQLRSSKQASPRSDVWSLGVVLFELLTRRWPFEADSLPDLCLKVAQEAPVRLSELREDLPAGLSDVVARCLAKDPSARYANAAELAFALAPYAESAAGETTSAIGRVERSLAQTRTSAAATQTHPPPPARVPDGRVRVLAVVAAVAALLAILLVRSGAGGDRLSLAAVEAALRSSSIAQQATPAITPTPAAASPGVAAPQPAEPSVSQPPRPRAIVPLRIPAPALRPVPRAATTPAAPPDDIPAFR